MKHYDVIIIGAGIAGTSLAASLAKTCPEKTFLILDKEQTASNEGYGSRITYEETIKKYNLPHEHIFQGMKIGNKKGIYLTVEAPFFVIDYKTICEEMLRRAKSQVKKETAIHTTKNILTTNKNKYHFKYLIDCSGHKPFLNKFIKRKDPLFYWIGYTSICKGKSHLAGNYFYLLAEDDGFIEDIYVIGNKISLGHWVYTDKIDYKKITPPKNKLSDKTITNLEIQKTKPVVVPGTPIIPLVKNNFAFLGDSLGNVTPVVGEGIRPIVESAEILTEAIKQDNLNLYNKEWKKRHLSKYLKVVAGKLNIKDRLKTGYYMTKYPEIFLKMIKLEDFEMPKQITKQIPLKLKLKLLLNLYKLKAKFFIMDPPF